MVCISDAKNARTSIEGDHGNGGAMMLEMQSYKPSIGLHGLVAGIYCYAADQTPIDEIETAPLIFPLIFSLANPWSVGFGTQMPQHLAGGFTAGLYAGPIHVTSRAELIACKSI